MSCYTREMKFAYFLTILVILCIIGMGISMQLNESFMGGAPAGGRVGGYGGNYSPTRHSEPGTWRAYSRESGGSTEYPSFAYLCETDSDCNA